LFSVEEEKGLGFCVKKREEKDPAAGFMRHDALKAIGLASKLGLFYGIVFFYPLQLTLHPYNFYNIPILPFVNILFFKVFQFDYFFQFFFLLSEHFTKCSGL
jgi:hypothetical protein